MAEIGSVTVAVSVEPTEEFDVVARAIGYAKERTCRPVDRYRDNDSMPWAYLVCSECGDRIRYRETVGEDGDWVCEMLPYCASCGARVEGAAK